jgi:glycogen debranching enzyme
MIKDKNESSLWDVGLAAIRELETEQGILASGKEEIYGCIFGRDSLITGLKLLKTYQKTGDGYFLALVKKILLNLASLQGKEINIESGEEPGKCIHEFRPDNHQHLTQSLLKPWYVYPDNAMRNYDTVDATPLFLATVYEYYRLSKDEEFMKEMLAPVSLALDWILVYGDTNRDGFLDYHFHPDRKCGGLLTQSWMDSSESLFHEDGSPAAYPIAPVEVQGYAYAALRAWGAYFKEVEPDRSLKLDTMAADLKRSFNEKFVQEKDGEFSLAFAIDGNGKLLSSPRSSMGHCLWIFWEAEDGTKESILDERYIRPLASRLLLPDLFEPEAGIRTLSSRSGHFDPESYHNGSIWPHDTAMIISGLESFGFKEEADRVRQALFSAFAHFQTPIELFVFTQGQFKEYRSLSGQGACKKQAWSAASLLAESSLSSAKQEILEEGKVEIELIPLLR